MREINYKSDFDFILHLKDCNGSEIGVPSCDFTITLWTWSKANVFKASRKGDRLENCFIDGGKIHVVCKNHRMGAGELHAEFHAELPNDIYPEGIQNRYQPGDLGIRLGAGAGEAEGICPQTMNAELKVPVGGKGQGNTGTGRLRFLQNGMISNHAREGVLYRNLGWIKLRGFASDYDESASNRYIFYYDLNCIDRVCFSDLFKALAENSGSKVPELPLDSKRCSAIECPDGIYIGGWSAADRRPFYTWNEESGVLALNMEYLDDKKFSELDNILSLRLRVNLHQELQLTYLMKKDGLITGIQNYAYDVVERAKGKIPDLKKLPQIKRYFVDMDAPVGKFFKTYAPELLGCEFERRRSIVRGSNPNSDHFERTILRNGYKKWRKIPNISNCNACRGVFRVRYKARRSCEANKWVYFTFCRGSLKLL